MASETDANDPHFQKVSVPFAGRNLRPLHRLADLSRFIFFVSIARIRD